MRLGRLPGKLRKVLAGSHADQMAFANSISIGNGNHVTHEWDEAFRRLGADPGVQDIQLARVDAVYKKSLMIMRRNSAWRES